MEEGSGERFGIGGGERGSEHTKGEDDTEGIKDDIRHGVLGESLHARIVNQAAPEPSGEFDHDGENEDDYRRQCQLYDGVVA